MIRTDLPQKILGVEIEDELVLYLKTVIFITFGMNCKVIYEDWKCYIHWSM